MSAAVTESQSSWPARASRTSVAIAPAPASMPWAEWSASPSSLVSSSASCAAERAALGDLRDLLGGRVPEQ